MEAARVIELDYAPRRVFLPYHDRTQRFAAGVAHRRAGKTVGAINDLVRGAILNRLQNPRSAYVAPLFNQAKDVAWIYLKHYARPLLAKPPNESELYVELINGARVRLYGADNPDRLRGIYLDDVVLDEYADMHPAVWPEVIRPLLADRRGRATFIGTPRGRNAFCDIYERAKLDADWFTFMLKASETNIIHPDELIAAARDMTPEQYAQEFECSFEAAILGAYYGKEVAQAEREGRITDVPYEPLAPVYTAWDLGKGANMAVWFWQIVGQEIHVIDYHEGAHSDGIPQTHTKLLAMGYPVEQDWVPHDAKATEIGTGRTRIEQFLSLRRRPRLVPDHKEMDGISAGRMTLPRCYFDRARCADGLEALRQFRADYDDKTRAFKDTPKPDWTNHAADAFRYLAMAWREIVPAPKVEAKPLLGVADMTFDEMLRSHGKKRSGRI